ncbi:glycosyltransferase family 4 protein [Variovorax ureilyticus]|uniref:Glycosyltransferase family 4 protein n=1 Tax=Variovorax ureilyticus TaxID=1836198 RepID=A0ABU8VLD2_9BURK
MKIALVSPLCEAVPPMFYGGTERVVAHLSNALVDQGHDVTLFAAGGSCTRATLVPFRQQALRLDPAPLKSDLAAHLVLMSEVRRRADEFDVLHFHMELLHFPFFEDIAERTLTTMHGRLDLTDLPEAYGRWNEFPLVSISHQQRKPMASANWLGNVYNGVDDALFRVPARPSGGYLAFLGRIAPEKRPDRAIDIAIRAGLPLKIAAKVDPVDRAYFEGCIRPLLAHPLIEFVGEVNDAQKPAFLGNARALLFPIDWPEPFGLVMIEAMACGTPVIAWRCGSVPEVVEPGVSGLIVDNEEEAVDAVKRAVQIDRRRVRASFDRRFSARAMATAYVELYHRLLAMSLPAVA